MKVAVVTMHVKQGKCEENVSYMKQMIQKAREEQADMIVFPQNAVSGYLLGVNPFNQPGVESYKKNMFALLGKPGFEAEREELLKRL